MYVTDQGHGKSPDLPRPPAPRGRPTPPEPAAKCPRCASTNTKFCYYNNYNKSQPRHLCKSCKRHWTKGGTLRNVPVGGARSKNKRSRINIPKPIAGNINHDQQKSVSSILYRALIGGPTSSREKIEANTTTTDDHFQFSSMCAFEITSPPDLNPVEYRYNLDSVEESINNNNDNKDNNTTISNIPSTSNGSWPGPDTGSCFELLPNYWNWSEIEVLASSDEHDLNISWDEIKP